jgi:DME family drug/metabolite transporter
MLSILGAGLLLAGSGINSGSSHAYLGGLVAIASSFFFGTFVIMNGGSSHSRKHNSLHILFWIFIGASLSCSVVGLLLGTTPGAVSFVLPHFTTHQWELLGGLSFFSSSIPFLLLTLGERTIQASTASIILLLTPISSGVISVIVLGEFLTLVQIIGGCFVLIGIALVIMSR